MKITIELDPDELVDAIARLAGALAQPKQPPAYPFAGVATIAQLDPAGELEFVQKTQPPRTLRQPVEPEAFTTLAPAPEAVATSPTIEAPPPAPKPTAQQRLAASKAGADLAAKRRANGAGMEFEAFGALVRKEVRRLAAGKTMPSHAFWNEFRDPALPTLSTVIARYGAGTAEELATQLGYNAPLRGIKPQQPAGEETQAAEAVSA